MASTAAATRDDSVLVCSECGTIRLQYSSFYADKSLTEIIEDMDRWTEHWVREHILRHKEGFLLETGATAPPCIAKVSITHWGSKP